MALQLYAGPVDIPRPTNYTHKDNSLETQEQPLDKLQKYKILKRGYE